MGLVFRLTVEGFVFGVRNSAEFRTMNQADTNTKELLTKPNADTKPLLAVRFNFRQNEKNKI